MKKLKHPFMLIVNGPTGAGKTDFALNIAKYIPSEIINLDVGQFYMPLTIGTAKPDWRTSKTPHHLFDIINEPRNLTVIEYRNLLLDTLNDIWSRGKMPILVGGSSFYLKSIFFPPRAQATYDAEPDKRNASDLWLELYKIDPIRAHEIDRNDMYRIKRAIEIWNTTGILPSHYAPEYMPLAPFHLVYITRDRSELYQLINKRVVNMIENGWIQEVEQLVGTKWESFINEKKIIGYNEILAYIKKENDLNDLGEVIRIIKKRTRNYAKRQLTFWRMLEKNIHEALQVHDIDPQSWQSGTETINLTLIDLNLYIKQLLKNLSILFE